MVKNGAAVMSAVEASWAICHSERGDSHEIREAPCQDSSIVVTGSASGIPYFIGAVADGHGSAEHDLSEIGSILATEAALDCSTRFIRNHHHLRFDQIRKLFDSWLGREIVKDWRKRVEDDAQRRLTPPSNDSSVNLYTRYGSTIILTILIRNYLLIGRIGDGEAIVFLPLKEETVDLSLGENKETKKEVRLIGEVQFIFPEPPAQNSSITDSLCMSDASTKWKTQASEIIQDTYLLLSTDGLSDSFPNRKEFTKFIQNFFSITKNYGIDPVSQSLPFWLREYSANGSGDDISVVAARFRAPPITTENAKERDSNGDQ